MHVIYALHRINMVHGQNKHGAHVSTHVHVPYQGHTMTVMIAS